MSMDDIMSETSLCAEKQAAYAILQLPAGASPQAIKAQYNALVDKTTKQELSYDEPSKEEEEARTHKLNEMHIALKVLSESAILEYSSAFRRPTKTLHPPRTPVAKYNSHDSWIAARDGRDWPVPPRRNNEGRYIRDV